MSTAAQQIQSAALCRDMCRRLQLFNFDERRLVDRVMQRLEFGRHEYGPLDLSVKRNWRKERFDERLDALVYDVAEELAAEDVALAGMREDARAELAVQGAERELAADRQREIARWGAEQPTRVSKESEVIAFADVLTGREPYIDFRFDDPEGG